MAHFSLTDGRSESWRPAGEATAYVAAHRRAESGPAHRFQPPLWMGEAAARLAQAEDDTLPVAQRLREVAAMSEALDRLFVDAHSALGGAPEQIALWAERYLQKATALMQEELLPNLCRCGVCIVPVATLGEAQRSWLHAYFRRSVYPLLTPLAVDPGHPFPYISSDSLNLLVELRPVTHERTNEGKLFARVKVPRVTPRLVEVPDAGECAGPMHDGSGRVYVWSADMIRYFIGDLFAEMPVRRVHLFRVLRAEATEYDERTSGRAANERTFDEPVGWRNSRTCLPSASDEGAARRRKETPAVRLDVEESMPQAVLEWLMRHLGLPGYSVFRHRCTLEMVCLPYLAEKAGGERPGVQVGSNQVRPLSRAGSLLD